MRPSLELLEPRLLPSVDITYGGGPTMPHVQVASLHADPATVAYTDAAMQVVVGQYLPLLSQYYGIGAGTLSASVNVAPLAGNPTDAQIRQAIVNAIQNGNAPPLSASQVYAYFLAPGQFVADPQYGATVAGYHSFFMLGGKSVYYAVIYDGPPEQLSQVEGHEIAETVTDAQPLTGWANRALGGAGEVADFWMWQDRQQFTLGGFLFSALAAPDGTAIVPALALPPILPSAPPPLPSPVPPTPPAPFNLAQLEAIPVEEARLLVYDLLARVNPMFAEQRDAARAELAANPMAGTIWGQAVETKVQEVFIEAIGGNDGP